MNEFISFCFYEIRRVEKIKEIGEILKYLIYSMIYIVSTISNDISTVINFPLFANLQNMDFNFYPPQITIQAGGNMNFTMMVRSLGIRNSNETRMHLVLTAKIKNSSVIFSYPVLLILPENN